MSAAIGIDLRQRVVGEVLAGASRHAAAGRFCVSVSSAIRWAALRDKTGSVQPRPRGGKSRSPLAPHTDWLLSLNRTDPDLTLMAIVARIGKEWSLLTTEASLRRFFKRHRISFKKKHCTPASRSGLT